MQSVTQKNMKSGMGIALGLPFGALLGMLFLDGNAGLGLGIGLLFGAVYESCAQYRVFPWPWSLGGAAIGAATGALLGLLHGQHSASIGQATPNTLFGLPYQPDYLAIGALVAAAAGVAIGIVFEQRRQDRVR